jgi:predicted RNA-binding Zn-ribbon protein involved in translation (DUF1610 family)
MVKFGSARRYSARLCVQYPAPRDGRGIIEMREYSEYVACPCCGETMQLARTASHAELPALETFQCKPCGLAVTAEAVIGNHAVIEKRYPW